MSETAFKPTRAERQMLEDLVKRGPLLCGRWEFSRSRTPSRLRQHGLIRRVDHPTVVDRKWNTPAEAFEITDEGRAALTPPPSP